MSTCNVLFQIYVFCLSAPDFIYALHLVGVVADARDFERCVWRNQQRSTVGNARVNVPKSLVVPFMPRLERLVYGRIATKERFCKAVLP